MNGGGDSRNAKIQHSKRVEKKEKPIAEVEAKEEEEDDDDDEEYQRKKEEKKNTHTQEENATDFCVVLAGLCFLEDTEKEMEIYCAHFNDCIFYDNVTILLF